MANLLLLLAGATGIEPATSDVTGRRSNQLNYAPHSFFVLSYKTKYIIAHPNKISRASTAAKLVPWLDVTVGQKVK